jgi:flavin reductase (DIM6/NTAB) family NADH-FMN oxidoreductase RutF/pimeloyl-ACP methyl ester carboxylesterase
MMTISTRSFRGFGGVRLEAEIMGVVEDPAVLLIHGGGQTRAVWRPVAEALAAAGRYVINLDLRGHGNSEWPTHSAYAFDAFVEDLRAVLAQLATRPVIVAATLGGWIATAALRQDSALLATGLVLVDLPTHVDPETSKAIAERLRASLAASSEPPPWDVRLFDDFDTEDMPARLAEAAPAISIPVLYVRGGLSPLVTQESAAEFVGALPNAEAVEVEDADILIVENRTEAFNGLLLDFLERRHPRAASEFRAGSDARTLRDAMGCFATGVTIVTAFGADGLPIGLTANSFTSVSLDPPLLLVCIANTAGSAPVLRGATRFAVNVLQIGQQPTSNRFAGKGEDRFAATPWEKGEFDSPVLLGSLTAFECEQESLYEAGDHFLLIGRVLKASFEPRRDPLLYFRGKYRRLHFA